MKPSKNWATQQSESQWYDNSSIPCTPWCVWQHLLVVQTAQRYTVDEALKDKFFNNDLCRRDLAELERKVGQHWLTSTMRRNFLRFNSQESIDVTEFVHQPLANKSSLRSDFVWSQRMAPVIHYQTYWLDVAAVWRPHFLSLPLFVPTSSHCHSAFNFLLFQPEFALLLSSCWGLLIPYPEWSSSENTSALQICSKKLACTYHEKKLFHIQLPRKSQ